MIPANSRIRLYAKKQGVLLWQIADRIGISDGSLTRRLRKPLPQDEETAILAVIDEIAQTNMEET